MLFANVKGLTRYRRYLFCAVRRLGYYIQSSLGHNPLLVLQLYNVGASGSTQICFVVTTRDLNLVLVNSFDPSDVKLKAIANFERGRFLYWRFMLSESLQEDW